MSKFKFDIWVKPWRLKMMLIVLVSGILAIVQYHIICSWMVASSVAAPSIQVPMKITVNIDNVLDSLKSNPKFSNIEEDSLKQIVLTVSKACNCGKKTVKSIQLPPPLYVITPTYRRPEQIAELTRLGQSLMHVPNLHWLVIEDAKEKTPSVTNLLSKSGIPFDHLLAPMPEKYKSLKGSKPRGVSNRNKGLDWLRANATHGVFYFADDDNTYDIEIFEEMRYTKRVTMWPVGLCTRTGLSSPILKNGIFVGFFDGWMAGRKFPVDMAGFAVSVNFLLKRPHASMPYKPGFEEDGFLKSLAPFEPKQIEFKAQNCSKILVWHTQTKKNEPALQIDTIKYNNTNLLLLRSQIV